MQKLIDYHKDLVRGIVLRFPGSYPHEKYVDLMLVDFLEDDGRFGFVVSTGHKAGLILVKLPKEAELSSCIGINKQWLIDNWNKWIYETCTIDEVNIIENYPVPNGCNSKL